MMLSLPLKCMIRVATGMQPKRQAPQANHQLDRQTKGTVLTIKESNRLYQLVCALTKCSGFSNEDKIYMHVLKYGDFLFSRLCCAILRRFTVLRTPPQSHGPGSACSKLFQCAIQRFQRFLSLTQDTTGNSLHAATLYM